MKIALCFFGQPRLLNNISSWMSQKIYLIDKYNPDIYIHSWISGEEKEFEYSDLIKVYKKNLINKEIKKSDEIILNRYKPKKYIFEKPKNFEFDENTRQILNKRIQNKEFPENTHIMLRWNKNNDNNFLSHLYSMSKVINLIDGYYDWVILTRFDVFLNSNSLNLYNLDNNYLYSDNMFPNQLNDIIILSNYNKIISLNLFEKINYLANYVNDTTPEQFKTSAYLMNNTLDTIKFIKMDIGIVRTSNMEHAVLKKEDNWI